MPPGSGMRLVPTTLAGPRTLLRSGCDCFATSSSAVALSVCGGGHTTVRCNRVTEADAHSHATLTRASSLGAKGFTVTAEISEMGSCVAHECVRKTQSESESESMRERVRESVCERESESASESESMRESV